MTHLTEEIKYSQEQAEFFERLALNASSRSRQDRFIKSVKFWRDHILLLRKMESKEKGEGRQTR